MTLLERRRALISAFTRFIKTVVGKLPLLLTACVNDKSTVGYKLYGESVQDGTPTPDTPVEVVSVGELVTDETDVNYGKYKIPVKARGKNLFTTKRKEASQGVRYTALDNNSFQIVTTGSATSKYLNFSPFALKKQTEYCLTCILNSFGDTNKISHNRIYIWGRKGTSGSWTVITTTPAIVGDFTDRLVKKSFNTGDYEQIQLSYYAVVFDGADLVGYTATLTKVQLEYGTTATPFEPYQAPITTSIYLDEPLRKIGEYADYIDFENQVVVRNIKKAELNKATSDYVYIKKNGVYFYGVLDANYNRNTNALSNRNYNSWTETQTYKNTSGMWVGASGGGAKSVYWIGILDVLGLTTLTEFNEWLANNPTYVLYGSTNPTTTPIELPTLPTFKGTTIYSVDTSVQPSNMEVTYYSKEKAV